MGKAGEGRIEKEDQEDLGHPNVPGRSVLARNLAYLGNSNKARSVSTSRADVM